MLSNYDEWLSLAMERKGDILICYLHPEGLVWDKESRMYERKGFKYESEFRFDIAGKESDKWVPLEEFSDGFAGFIYGREFKHLPKAIKKGNTHFGRARIMLPKDGELRPAGRDFSYDSLCLFSRYEQSGSRGVKEKVIDRNKMISEVAKMIVEGTERMMPYEQDNRRQEREKRS